MEGNFASGLANRIPGIGPYLQRYGEYLFQDYIPRLKMAMAKAAYERNVERYQGKLTDDQILAKTAEQSNAAFGELNYKMLGRNPTVQGARRLTLLAPGFFEARARFVGQALSPYGAEQRAALLRGGLIMYAGAAMLNKMLDDQYHLDKPFTVVYNGHEYS